MSSNPKLCPSCGKEPGGPVVCQYCCAAIEPSRRITEKKLAMMAVGISIIGVVLLVWASRVETPITPIKELASEGSFLHFRVKGEVIRFSEFKTPYENANIHNFWIDDGSSDKADESVLKLKVEGPVYADLKERGKVPARGDTIDVEGTLYAGDGFRLLSLNTAAMLKLEKKEGK
jgi:hypothetical protein